MLVVHYLLLKEFTSIKHDNEVYTVECSLTIVCVASLFDPEIFYMYNYHIKCCVANQGYI